MKTSKAKRWTKDSKEEIKLTSLIKWRVARLGKKLGMSWLAIGAEFPRIKEEQFKRAFDRSMKILECEELCTLHLRHTMFLRF